MPNVNDPVYDDNVVDELFDGESVAYHGDSLQDGNTPTPPVTNQRGYLPYRGSEQHGVRFSDDMEGPNHANKYAAEQKAFETYVDPTVSVRDLAPMKPMQVEITNSPKLNTRKAIRIRSVVVPAGGQALIQLVPEDWNRSRLLVRASSVAGGTLYVKTSNDSNPTFDSFPVAVAAGTTANVFDTTATGPLWAAAVTGDIVVSLLAEFPIYDGEPFGV